jgi:hypothetical protein
MHRTKEDLNTRTLALDVPEIQRRNIKAMVPSLRVAFLDGWHAAKRHAGIGT